MGNLREGGGGTSCSEDDMFSRSAQESRPCIEDMPSSEWREKFEILLGRGIIMKKKNLARAVDCNANDQLRRILCYLANPRVTSAI